MVDTEPKVTQVTTGRHFPGEISGVEAKRMGINFNLSPETLRAITAITAAIAASTLSARFVFFD